METRANKGLRVARLLMVVSSLAPLFLLWAIRGAPPIPDWIWMVGCLLAAVVPNLALAWRWQIARRRNDHRAIIVHSARDQSEHLLVYLFAMLLPLYTANLSNERELFSVLAAFVFIVFLFWHMNLHYMNVVFAALGYRLYTVERMGAKGSRGEPIILLSRRTCPPEAGETVDGIRISDTVYVERGGTDAA